MSTYLRVLRHRDFRLLFLGQAASAVGDQVVFVALALFIIRRSGSVTDLGLVLAAQTLPLVALLLFGGVWADRLPRHRIMIVCDLLRAGLHAGLAVLIFTGAVRIWQLIAIEMVFGAARAFFQPAYSGLVPQTVPESLIQDAKALTEGNENLASVIGPVFATVLVLGVGAGEAFAFDAATFIVSALLLARVHPRPRGPEPVRESVWHELRSGWHEVASRPWVWVTIVAFTGAVLCSYAQWSALAPLIARDVYGGIGVFGILETVTGIGAVCGALAAVALKPSRPVYAGLVLALAWPAQAIVFALGAPLPLVIVFALMNGFGFTLMVIWWETALAHHIPPHALSRVSAWDWMGSLALMPLGFALAGPLASAFGARTVLGVGSGLAIVMLLLSLLPRSTRELGGAPASAEQVASDLAVEVGSEA